MPEKPAKTGVKANDLDEEEEVIDPLEKKMKTRFEQTWATLRLEGESGRPFCVRLSHQGRGARRQRRSGSPAATGSRPTNRTCIRSSIIRKSCRRSSRGNTIATITPSSSNEKLASIYEFYIKRDFELSAAQAGKPSASPHPICSCRRKRKRPSTFARPPQLFKPLRLNREVSVQPLLTPDNYAQHVLKLIKSAKKSVWFQNQYINFRGTEDDFTEFRLLVGALKDKIDKELDVRIICRDMMKQESLDVLIALGFPKEVFRFQPACHNKTIIVDGKIVDVRQPQLVERGREDQP